MVNTSYYLHFTELRWLAWNNIVLFILLSYIVAGVFRMCQMYYFCLCNAFTVFNWMKRGRCVDVSETFNNFGLPALTAKMLSVKKANRV